MQNKLNLFAGNFLTLGGRVDVGGVLRNSISPLPVKQGCLIYGYESRLFDTCRLILSGSILDEWRIDRYLKLWGGFGLFSFSDLPFEWLSHFNPKAGIMITPSNNWLIKLNYSRGISLPTLEQKFDNYLQNLQKSKSDNLLSINLLQPEKAQMIELSLAYVETYQQIKYFIQLSGHVTKVADAIEKLSTGTTTDKLENNLDYLIFGSEANTEVTFADGSYLFFNLSWFRGYWQKVEKSGNWLCEISGFAGVNKQNQCREINNFPRLKMNTGANIVIGSWLSLFFSVELGSERNNMQLSELAQIQSTNISPYALVNLSVKSKPIFGFLTLQGSVFNLFNFKHDYSDLMGSLPEFSSRTGTFFYLGANVSI